MFVYVAWFATRSTRKQERLARWERARRYLDEITPPSWTEHAWHGEGWGVVLRQATPDIWRWTFGEQAHGRSTVCAGIALGAGVTSPDALGRRLLAGEDVHKNLAAPLALLTVDDHCDRMLLQQDWHGMGQAFRYDGPDAVAFSNRPSLLPTLFGQAAKPNLRGWSLYLSQSAFCDDSSPVRGVHLLEPGVRVTGIRRNGRWHLDREKRFGIDDLIDEALATRPSLDQMSTCVVDAVRRVVHDLAAYWPGPLRMGLSGGKDSRLLAAALIDEGLIAGFRTNEEYPAEGKIARILHEILREERGLDLSHEYHIASPPDGVLGSSIPERAARLHKRHDFMFRSSYLNRPPAEPHPHTFPRPRVLGVFGEYVSDMWIPQGWQADPASATYDQARIVLRNRLMRTPRAALRPRALAPMLALIDGYVRTARERGISAFGTVHLGYIMGRIRRTCSSLTNPEQIMPMAMPETVRVSFQLTAQEKVDWALHRRVIDRAVPAWSHVPVVSSGMPTTAKVRIWHGTGTQELRELLAQPAGPITHLLKRQPVRAALNRAEAGKGGDPADTLLRQFAMAAAADSALAG